EVARFTGTTDLSLGRMHPCLLPPVRHGSIYPSFAGDVETKWFALRRTRRSPPGTGGSRKWKHPNYLSSALKRKGSSTFLASPEKKTRISWSPWKIPPSDLFFAGTNRRRRLWRTSTVA